MKGWLVTILLVFLGLSAILPGGGWTTAADSRAATPKAINRSSSALALTSDNATLLVVNPDSNSISLVDTATLKLIAELRTGVDPHTVAVDEQGERAYVADRGSGTVTVINPAARTVVEQFPVGRRPYGMVLSKNGSRLYVAEQGADQVRVVDTSSKATLALLPSADRPSGLVLSENGKNLYVTHLLKPRVTKIKVDPLPQAGAEPSTTVIALWPDSNLVQAIILAPDLQFAYLPHTRSNSTNQALSFDTTVFPVVSAINLASGTLDAGRNIPLDTADRPVGLPFAAAFTPDGKQVWVVNAASNNVSVINLESRKAAANIAVGDNPRGIVIAPDGRTAYVNNTLAGTVSVIDTASCSVTATVVVTSIPLPPLLLRGKRLFHSSADPRMSNLGWISCNTCHFEGEQDGRTWRFGFTGPRNTTSLLGMIRTYPLRWSGEWNESADSEFAIRKENFGTGLIEGEMHCTVSPADCAGGVPNQGCSHDLDALAAFMDSLQVPLSPNHAGREPLSKAEKRGKAVFNRPEFGCLTCHPPPLYTDQKKHNVGTTTADEKIGPDFDTPSLLGLYDSAPFFHDGRAATLAAALMLPTPGSEHDLRGRVTKRELQDLVAFLKALPFE